MKSLQLFTCPSDSGPKFDVPGFGNGLRRSYAIATYTTDGIGGINMSAYPETALTLLVTETRSCADNGTNNWRGCSQSNNTDQMAGPDNRELWRSPVGSPFIHLGTANLLYMDGHAKAYKGTRGSLRRLDKHPYGNEAPGEGGTWFTNLNDIPK